MKTVRMKIEPATLASQPVGRVDTAKLETDAHRPDPSGVDATHLRQRRPIPINTRHTSAKPAPA